MNKFNNDIKSKRICFQCTAENYLSAEIERLGKRSVCSYCKKIRPCYLIDRLADHIERAFTDHYIRTSDQPDAYQSMMLRDRESNYDWEREGETTTYAIMNAAEIPEAAAEDLQIVLNDRHSDFEMATMGEETEFASEASYEQKGVYHSEWNTQWNSFEKSLKTETRFFNQSAATHLASLFDGIGTLATRKRRSVVVKAGPGTTWKMLFRARVFQSDSELSAALAHPDRHLGPPPPQVATAGRMNARGISVFYGASSQAAALAEVRPPVGSQVAIARFRIIRLLRLLDLTAFEELITPGSIFDPAYLEALKKAAFLRTLGQRLSRPVMPNDEALEYLATQAVADFLATERNLKLDGLIFPAVQAAGTARNVVLFQKASRVRSLNLPEGAKVTVDLDAHDEDGWYRDYTVTETIPPPAKHTAPVLDCETFPNNDAILHAAAEVDDVEWSSPPTDTLEIMENEVEIHIVSAVKFKASKYSVRRYRWDKTEIAEF